MATHDIATTIHPQTRIGHIHITVADLNRSLAFYRDLLGFAAHEGVEAKFREVIPGVNVDMDEEGQVIGVEILGASLVLGNVLEPLYGKKKAA